MSALIQYRAWDDYHKVMINDWLVQVKDSFQFEGYDTTNNVVGVTDIMPYVGWTDKTGKIIYTKDIVKISNDNPVDLIGEVKQMPGGQFYIAHKKASLKYAHQNHCEYCDEGTAFFIDFFEPWELEVIGNIYETPELLP